MPPSDVNTLSSIALMMSTTTGEGTAPPSAPAMPCTALPSGVNVTLASTRAPFTYNVAFLAPSSDASMANSVSEPPAVRTPFLTSASLNENFGRQPAVNAVCIASQLHTSFC